MYSDLKYEIIRKQADDLFIQEEIKRIGEGKPSEFQLGDFDSLYFQKRICVLDDPEVKAIIRRKLMKHLTQYIREVPRCICTTRKPPVKQYIVGNALHIRCKVLS
jgi:hypothetical protein